MSITAETITINGVKYVRKEEAKPVEIPDEPEQGSYWAHDDKVYIAIPMVSMGMYLWQLSDPKTGCSWSTNKAQFKAATRADLIAYLQR